MHDFSNTVGNYGFNISKKKQRSKCKIEPEFKSTWWYSASVEDQIDMREEVVEVLDCGWVQRWSAQVRRGLRQWDSESRANRHDNRGIGHSDADGSDIGVETVGEEGGTIEDQRNGTGEKSVRKLWGYCHLCDQGNGIWKGMEMYFYGVFYLEIHHFLDFMTFLHYIVLKKERKTWWIWKFIELLNGLQFWKIDKVWVGNVEKENLMNFKCSRFANEL